jgi:hypothetical protein
MRGSAYATNPLLETVKSSVLALLTVVYPATGYNFVSLKAIQRESRLDYWSELRLLLALNLYKLQIGLLPEILEAHCRGSICLELWRTDLKHSCMSEVCSRSRFYKPLKRVARILKFRPACFNELACNGSYPSVYGEGSKVEEYRES